MFQTLCSLQSDLAYATFQFSQLLRDVDRYTVHGVIGPQDSKVAIFSLANIATRYQATQVLTFSWTGTGIEAIMVEIYFGAIIRLSTDRTSSELWHSYIYAPTAKLPF